MKATVIIGAQYGSEGKGKIAAYLSDEFARAVRTGGPNSGHTVERNGTFYQVRAVPSAFVNQQCRLAIGAGAIINTAVLLGELTACGIVEGRLIVDPQAVIIDEEYQNSELDLISSISSTGQGVGAAIAAKVLRRKVTLARDVPELRPLLADVAGTINSELQQGLAVMIEGSQGFFLSLHHGYYPFVTGRETTASSFCAEVGIGPKDVGQVIGVLRTHPIRVGGPSGPLQDEIVWQTVTAESGYPTPLLEITTVTKRIRRVGRFSMAEAKRSLMINSATQIALNFVDYLDHANFGLRSYTALTASTKKFIDALETQTGVPVSLVGTGPRNSDMIDLRREKNLPH